MAVVGLVAFGSFERRVNGARHALKSWGYRLIKTRGSKTIHDARFAIVDVASGAVILGGSALQPEATLVEVEAWFNAQGFEGKLAADGTRMRDTSPETMTAAQRDVLNWLQSLPLAERRELVRYLSASLLLEKFAH